MTIIQLRDMLLGVDNPVFPIAAKANQTPKQALDRYIEAASNYFSGRVSAVYGRDINAPTQKLLVTHEIVEFIIKDLVSIFLTDATMNTLADDPPPHIEFLRSQVTQVIEFCALLVSAKMLLDEPGFLYGTIDAKMKLVEQSIKDKEFDPVTAHILREMAVQMNLEDTDAIRDELRRNLSKENFEIFAFDNPDTCGSFDGLSYRDIETSIEETRAQLRVWVASKL